MQQIFIELYNYRSEWHALPQDEKQRFADGVSAAVAEVTRNGVEVIAWGMNDPATDRRAPYDFFCLYRVPNVEFQRVFEQNIAASGWYNYFEQTNVSGAVSSPRNVLDANVARVAPTRQQ